MMLRLADRRDLLNQDLARGARGADGMMLRLADPTHPPRVLHRRQGDGAGGTILGFADPARPPGPCTAAGTMERAA